MKKITLLTLLATFWLSSTVSAQYDPLYNQYNFDQLMINPAYTGTHDLMSFSVLTRQQWAGIDGAPLTLTATGHTSISNNNAGVGAMIIHERFGVNENTELYASYAYKINFGRGTLAAGLQGGIMLWSYDYGTLNLEQDNDPAFNPLTEQISQSNFGAGVWYKTDNYYVGVSVPRMLEISVDVDPTAEPTSRYRRHFYLSAGGILTLNPTLKIKPYALVRVVNQLPSNLDIGANLLIRELIWAGLLVRDFRGFALMGQMELNDMIRAGLSWELATTKLSKDNFGTAEIMLIFDFAVFSQQVLRRRYF